jgi:hypothetical protein
MGAESESYRLPYRLIYNEDTGGKGKGKGKFSLEQAAKAQRGSVDLVLFFPLPQR